MLTISMRWQVMSITIAIHVGLVLQVLKHQLMSFKIWG